MKVGDTTPPSVAAAGPGEPDQHHLVLDGNPLTIAEALEVSGDDPLLAEEHCGESKARSSRATVTSHNYLDVLGIVMHLATKSGDKSAEVWIVDASLSTLKAATAHSAGKSGYLYARLTLVGSTAVQAMKEQIQVGDVVCFHHLCRSSARREFPSSRMSPFCVGEFSQFASNVRTHWQWIGRLPIDADISLENTTQKQNPSALLLPPVVGRSGRQTPGPLDARAVTTSLRRINELLHWWWYDSDSKHYHQRLHRLDPLPCQTRSLSELQSLLGVQANVVVTVVSYDKHTTVSKRKRYLRETCSVDGVAVLADYKNNNGGTRRPTLMTLLDVGSRFCRILSRAVDGRHVIKMTQLLCQKARDASPSSHEDDEVVLVPTQSSRILVLEEAASQLAQSADTRLHHQRPISHQNDEFSCPWLSTNRDQKNVLPTSSTTTRRRALSSVLHDILVEVDSSRDTVGSSTSRRKSILASSLNDLEYHSPEDILSLLMDDSAQQYRSATVILDHFPQEQDEKGAVTQRQTIHAQASGNIIKTLCGGVEVQDMFAKAPPSSSSVNQSRHSLSSPQEPLTLCVTNLVQSLLRESAVLTWTLEESFSSGGIPVYKVADVRLPVL